MSELRQDPVTGVWVVIAPERKKRPRLFHRGSARDLTGSKDCPFCAGNEGLTPPEILAVRPPGTPAGGPGWQLRVFPNRFPALRVEGNLERRGDGLYDRMNGIGAHEVIVESPDHATQLADLPPAAMNRVLTVFQQRIRDLKNDLRLRYVMIFKNQGPAAGASLPHTHSQLVALPVVPLRVRQELEGARRHFQQKERCLFCDIVAQEIADGQRLVWEDAMACVVAPYAPRFPFELAIYPRRHGARFEDCPESELAGVGAALTTALGRLNLALKNPDYNLVLHNAPSAPGDEASFHWHFEVMPALGSVAGFEWGSGFSINPIPPEEAAAVLREVRP